MAHDTIDDVLDAMAATWERQQLEKQENIKPFPQLDYDIYIPSDGIWV